MNIIMRGAAAGVAALLWTTAAFAENAPAEEGSFFGNLYKEVNGFSGYTSSEVGEGADTPTLIQLGFGITAAMPIGDSMFAGLSSDFRFINQYSDIDATVGNRRGTRWNLASPTFGYRLGDLTLKADVQFLGAYNLTNETAGGQEASFSSPLGGRVTALYPVMDKIHLGAQFEYLTFGKQVTGETETELTEKLTLWQAGITAAYVF